MTLCVWIILCINFCYGFGFLFVVVVVEGKYWQEGRYSD